MGPNIVPPCQKYCDFPRSVYFGQLKRKYEDNLTNNKIDLDKTWIVEKGLHLSIQILLDIGNHILAAEGITVERYADIFIRLAELGIIPLKFAEEIKGMADCETFSFMNTREST